MYDNKVYYVSQVEAQKKLTELKKRDEILTVVIDGTKIKNWDDYIKAVTEAFHFPTFEKRNYDGYLYYFTDLMWIDKDAFALFILDYDEFMNQNINEKKWVMKRFCDHILFWWGEDVEVHCMGGESKEFNIYLVNGYESK